MSRLSDFVQQNKTPLAVTGAAAVAGLAVLNSRRGASTEAAAEEQALGTSAKPYSYSAGGVPATGYPGVYDSTGSDVYNALQPQLENIGSYLDRLTQRLDDAPPIAVPGAAPAPPAPVPAPATPAPAPPTPVLAPYKLASSGYTWTPVNASIATNSAGGYNTTGTNNYYESLRVMQTDLADAERRGSYGAVEADDLRSRIALVKSKLSGG